MLYCTYNLLNMFRALLYPSSGALDCTCVFYPSNKPTWCTRFLFYSKFISCLYIFRAHVLIIRRSKLHYTASGIIKPIGGHLVHETATYRFDDTRGCVIQFWPPDDEHMCSKHVEAWNKLTVKQKFCASSWLITEINILRCTVSKTSTKYTCVIAAYDV